MSRKRSPGQPGLVFINYVNYREFFGEICIVFKIPSPEFLVKQGKQGLGILLPGRSYGNQDYDVVLHLWDKILLPGRSYGNQDALMRDFARGIILLPGRSYGNQDKSGEDMTNTLILLPGRSYGNQDIPLLPKSME